MFVLLMDFKMLKSFLSVFLILCTSIALSNAMCGQVVQNTVTEADIREILNTHNEFRTRVAEGQVPGQPRAKDMCLLKWDPGLAAEAQELANRCKFQHSHRDGVGQNLGWESWIDDPRAQWRKIITAWFNEYRDFSYPNQSWGITGHYKQVVWAATKYIGCGFVAHKGPEGPEKFYVCNYGPGGNMPGQPPYRA